MAGCFLLAFVPDTPRWFVMKGRSHEALAVLTRPVGEAEAHTTVKEIETSLAAYARAGKTPLFACGRGDLPGILLRFFSKLWGSMRSCTTCHPCLG